MTNGYEMYFDTPDGLLTFPITPSELNIKVGSKNETVTLINEGDINILKSPSLIEVEFEARFPMRKYPYSKDPLPFDEYLDIINKTKTSKKPFRFIVARRTVGGKRTWDTNLLMALESYDITESTDNGDDVLISFTLKQYKEYGVKILSTSAGKNTSFTKPTFLGLLSSVTEPTTTTTSTSATKRQSNGKTKLPTKHKVKETDNLELLAKVYYGEGTKFDGARMLYDANEPTLVLARKKASSPSSGSGASESAGNSSSNNARQLPTNTTIYIPNTEKYNRTNGYAPSTPMMLYD